MPELSNWKFLSAAAGNAFMAVVTAATLTEAQDLLIEDIRARNPDVDPEDIRRMQVSQYPYTTGVVGWSAIYR